MRLTSLLRTALYCTFLYGTNYNVYAQDLVAPECCSLTLTTQDIIVPKIIPIKEAHALSLFGEPKYPENFKAFDYVNQNAPKGGQIVLSASGGFDSLNIFNGKGDPAPGMALIYDSLMSGSMDEPASEYGLIAEKVRHPEDFSWVEYDLRASARWSDGVPITAEDVIFSLNILKEKGSPIYRYYYANIVKAEKISDHRVRFTFDKAGNRELPLITGQLTILPKHYWENRDFTVSTLDIPVGSGPYKVGSMTANRNITFVRNPDYWGKDLNVNKGSYNFDKIRYEVYRDTTVEFEAFKSGEFDFRIENSAKNWVQNYNFPAVKDGLVKKTTFVNLHPKPMQGLLFNLRRDLFKDPVLREALGYMLDFKWLNENIFFGVYNRSQSFFEESELEAPKLPTSAERHILKPYEKFLSPSVLTQEFKTHHTDDSRTALRHALKLLQNAGYKYKGGVLYTPKGEKVAFKILNSDPFLERVLIPIAENMRKIGADVTIHTIDPAQYVRRLQKFDYDMIMTVYPQSSSPGNEQREYWSSEAAERSGSRNYAGIKDKVVDGLIERLIFAKDRQDLVNSTHALDRVLQWKRFLIPLWYSPVTFVAYRNKFGLPNIGKTYGAGGQINLWWSAEHKKEK